MTTEEAIKKLENFANHIEPNEEFIMAIKALSAEKNSKNIKHRVSEIAMMCDEKDVKPIIYGNWIPIDDAPHEDFECDRCGYIIWMKEFATNYCPNCGAKMKKKVRDNE